tara:strand:+ start:167 stop:1402 length:1236 start_codon:yes stop_codon:yes gene_type:complete
MGGALLQLVSYGKQNEYLISNPSISYFKYVHKRHTNFSMESIPNNFNESLNFDRKVTCTIGKHGDLVNKMLLEIKLPAMENADLSGEPVGWTVGLGHSIIRKAEILIGGVIVDTIDGEWLDIYTEFNLDASKKKGYYEMIKYSKVADNYSYNDAMNLYIPLQFWFCRNMGSSLPLIALQYHDVTVNIHIRPLSECVFAINSNDKPKQVNILEAKLYCNYIFLDTKERKHFAQSSHEYLITQHQKNINNVINYSNSSLKVDLEFNLPVKTLYWTLQNREAQKMNLWNDFSLNPQRIKRIKRIEPLKSVEMKLNGHDRFSERSAEHFRLIEPYNFSNVIPDKFMYTYNFGINPDSYQPSGAINFSRIDSSSMFFNFNMNSSVSGTNDIDIKIYAINYNILIISNGMGGVKYND